MAEYGKTVRKVLRRNLCSLLRRGKGGHDIWFSPITGRYFTVDAKIKSRRAAYAVVEQSGD